MWSVPDAIAEDDTLDGPELHSRAERRRWARSGRIGSGRAHRTPGGPIVKRGRMATDPDPRFLTWWVACERRDYESGRNHVAPPNCESLAGVRTLAAALGQPAPQRDEFSESEPATGPPQQLARELLDCPRGPNAAGVTLAAA